MVTGVIEATEFDSDIICDHRGHLEAENRQKVKTMILPQNFSTILCGTTVRVLDFGSTRPGFNTRLRQIFFLSFYKNDKVN